MQLNRNLEFGTTWLELPQKVTLPLAQPLIDAGYQTRDIIGLYGPAYVAAANAINFTMIEAMAGRKPIVPFFESIREQTPTRTRSLRVLTVGTAGLSGLVDRPGLGTRFEAIAFLQHPSLPDEQYKKIVDRIIGEANITLAEAGFLPISTKAQAESFRRLFSSDNK